MTITCVDPSEIKPIKNCLVTVNNIGYWCDNFVRMPDGSYLLANYLKTATFEYPPNEKIIVTKLELNGATTVEFTPANITMGDFDVFSERIKMGCDLDTLQYL